MKVFPYGRKATILLGIHQSYRKIDCHLDISMLSTPDNQNSTEYSAQNLFQPNANADASKLQPI
jgi:hypothetical protein